MTTSSSTEQQRKEAAILEQIKEFRDDSETLDAKCAALAACIASAKHVVAFVGAGISASAGCRTFRGPEGVWTEHLLSKDSAKEEAQAVFAASAAAAASSKNIEDLVPTVTHRFLAKLVENRVAIMEAQQRHSDKGDATDPSSSSSSSLSSAAPLPNIAHIVSQNFDGLLMRSGVGLANLSELHGNAFIENCPNKAGGCGKRFTRTFDVCDDLQAFAGKCGTCLSNGKKLCHCTPRRCDVCGSVLKDNLIHFGESLEAAIHDTAMSHVGEGPLAAAAAAENKQSPCCDLLLVLGSSLMVWPAAKMLEVMLGIDVLNEGKKEVEGASEATTTRKMSPKGQVCIVNLQKTDFDDKIPKQLRIFAETDVVCAKVAALLNVTIPAYDASKSKLIATAKTKLSATHCFNGEPHKWETSSTTAYPCSVCKRSVKKWCAGQAQCCSVCCGADSEQ